MAVTKFNAGGMDAPEMVGTPRGTRGKGDNSPGVLPPGSTMVTSFDQAKEFARCSGDQNGSYTPLLRPGRKAERLAFPDAATKLGVSEI
jgi:hypothetical protein